MDTLLELAAILDRKMLAQIDVLDKTFLKKGDKDLYNKFYSGLLNRKFTDDYTASKALYGTDKPDHRYRMLKSRLKKRMYNTLLLLDTNTNFNNNEKNKKYYQCITTLNTVEILVKIKGTNKIVYELINENYKEALQNNFYDILKSYSYYLLLYYSLSGDNNNYFKELDKFEYYKSCANKELDIKQINSRILLFFSKPKPLNKKYIDEINSQLLEFEKSINEFPDPESKFYYYHSLSSFIIYTGDYIELIKITDLAEKLLKDYPFTASIGRKNILQINRLRVFLHLKMYENGLNLIKSSQTLYLDEGSLNWFVGKELEFKLNLHSHNIIVCKSIFEVVTKNKYFKRRFDHLIERWKIYEAYLVFMDSYVNKGDYKFAIGKFLNEVPFYTKDKSGFNFSIKVIEILFHFARKQYNIIFAKTDALKIYRTRYLNDDTYIRSRLFLSALLKAEKDGFNPKRMQQGYPEIDQLKNREKQLIIADWEVIPYEMIWDILVDLGQQQYTQTT